MRKTNFEQGPYTATLWAHRQSGNRPSRRFPFSQYVDGSSVSVLCEQNDQQKMRSNLRENVLPHQKTDEWFKSMLRSAWIQWLDERLTEITPTGPPTRSLCSISRSRAMSSKPPILSRSALHSALTWIFMAGKNRRARTCEEIPRCINKQSLGFLSFSFFQLRVMLYSIRHACPHSLYRRFLRSPLCSITSALVTVLPNKQ